MTQIEGKFLTTLQQVIGYDIVEGRGMVCDVSVLSANKAVKGIVKKAEEQGCNAVVNVRVDSGPNGFTAIGDAVVVKEKPFSY